MGIRPNQPHRRLVATPPRCRHSSPPVPVEVHDRLDGRPEVVAWLCPDCYEETYGPPPKGPGGSSRLGGMTTAEAAEGVRRIQYALRQRVDPDA